MKIRILRNVVLLFFILAFFFSIMGPTKNAINVVLSVLGFTIWWFVK